MTSLNKIADFRRPIAINLANRPTAAHCEDCGARHTGLCEVLADDELAFLARIAQRIALPAGALIMEEGEPALHFYNVNAGFIRLFKALPDGRRQITGFAGPGHFIGLAATAQNVVSAEAMEPVKLCRFSRVTMRDVFAELPQLERKLLDVAMHELVLGQQQMLLLGRKTALERLASFLLAWAERQEICAPGVLPRPHSVLALPLSRTDLADYLGLTIETVSRSLSTLRRDGLIDIPNIHEIILLRPQALAGLAEAAV
ncbi:Crp/Fnr family transcriptional regulator [Acidocella sp.]|uniref:Crp/Fnr family transcriptional regulator n=1 Tax=Acidocella sp. TaxID=50710 RepID=UPI0026270D86|nr:helix-turn-helix domain-containing protein [Acidocella sp.]